MAGRWSWNEQRQLKNAYARKEITGLKKLSVSSGVLRIILTHPAYTKARVLVTVLLLRNPSLFQRQKGNTPCCSYHFSGGARIGATAAVCKHPARSKKALQP